ncbi:unnamed protein product [Scytosiphon promiscuus]
MLASPQNWRVTYPRRSPHPRRPAMRSDGQGWVASSTQTNPPPRLALRPPPPLRKKTTAAVCPPSRQMLCREAAGGGRARPSVGGEGGPSDRGRAVRFEPVVKLILVPSRLDLGDARLSEELWWNDDDYLQFRLGAIVDESSGPLRRTYRSTRSKRRQSTGAGPPAYPSAQALGKVDFRSGSMRPFQQQVTARRVPSSSSTPSPPPPPRLRFQPMTQPARPVSRDVEGVIDRNSEPPVDG